MCNYHSINIATVYEVLSTLMRNIQGRSFHECFFKRLFKASHTHNNTLQKQAKQCYSNFLKLSN